MTTKITDVSQYFKADAQRMIFVGKKLEVYIPKIYLERKLFSLGETAVTLGILQLRINDMFYANMMLLCNIEIGFDTYRTETEDGYNYIVLELSTNSPFLLNRTLVKSSSAIYDIFVMFLALGKIPPFLDYDSIQKLFDNDNKHCGVSLGVNHTIFEMIAASIFRSQDDPYTFYRHTRMDKAPKIVPIHSISHGPISTTARVVGSYLSEGMTSALVDDTQRVPAKIENLLRS